VDQAGDVKPDEIGQVRSTDPGKAGKAISDVTSASDETSSSLYGSPSSALKDLIDSYHYWGEKLTDSSFALSLAVIGANWAAFGSIDQIRGNIWSEVSIASILVSLAINLVGMKRLAEAHRKQIEYAEANAARWKTEFDKAQNTSCPWPSTSQIDRLARNLRTSRTLFPLLGGALFILALFLSPPKPKSKTTESTQQSTAPTSPAAPTPTITSPKPTP
jgi:hypothetical protein